VGPPTCSVKLKCHYMLGGSCETVRAGRSLSKRKTGILRSSPSANPIG